MTLPSGASNAPFRNARQPATATVSVEAGQLRLPREGEAAVPCRPVGLEGASVSPVGPELVPPPLLLVSANVVALDCAVSVASEPPPQPYRPATAIRSTALRARHPPELLE